MGSICSCGAKQRCRIIILGLARTHKHHIYGTLTQDKIENDKFSQKRIQMYGMNVFLCNVGEDEASRSLWFCNARHSDGVVYVVDLDDNDVIEETMDEFKSLMDDKVNDKINVLVLATRKNPVDIEGNKINDLKNAEVIKSNDGNEIRENKINEDNERKNDEAKIEEIFADYMNCSNVNVLNCDITNWENVDTGLKWLCERISES